MRRLTCLVILALAIILTCLAILPATAADHPNEGDRNSIVFWRKNYEELSPAIDPQATRAHTIFHRVLQAAGAGPGQEPRLYLTKNTLNSHGAFARALPDNWIVLSQGALEYCYREPEKGDDRLAFVLAHEIAHQFKHDYQHVKFFQAINPPQVEDPEQQKILRILLEKMRTSAVVAEEREADEYGIFYALLAGFNPEAIVPAGDPGQFFLAWLRAQDPLHPPAAERGLAVKERLREITKQIDLFRMGLWFYQASDYGRAVSAFEAFLQTFPSREVYHNLGASHYQLALEYYRAWKGEELAIPYKLSLGIDPVTRARDRRGVGPEPQAALFKAHLDHAIRLYQTAIARNPAYALAYTNLGAALLMTGEVYKAIATLQDALKVAPDSPDVLNNLGVAFLYADNPAKGRTALMRAHALAPEDDAPLFNLGYLANAEQHADEAKHYGMAYLALDPESPWAKRIRQALSLSDPPSARASSTTEQILGVGVGAFMDDVPPGWGAPVRVSEVRLQGESFKVATYTNGALILSRDEEIHMIVTSLEYRGRSARGIAIGSPQSALRASYGVPSRRVSLTQGATWVYDAHHIAFQVCAGKVASWQLF